MNSNPSAPAGRVPLVTILALAAGNALGFSGTTALPLWLAALPHANVLDVRTAGILGSAEVLLIALSTMAASTVSRGFSARRFATAAAVAALVGDLLCLAPGIPPLVAGRLISGAATGALLACVTGLAARQAGAQKIMAWMQLGLMIFATAFYLVAPRLIPGFGPGVIFAGLALLAAACTGLCWAGLPDDRIAAPDTDARLATASSEMSTRGFQLVAVAGCLAIALVFVGQSAVWTSVVNIGQLRGFSMQTVGAVMAACAAVNIAGPLAGRALGERLGLSRPMITAFVALAGAAVLAASAATLSLFALAVVLLVLLPGFALPYAFAFLGRIGDDRYAAAGPAFLMLGSAAGPLLGGWLLGGGAGAAVLGLSAALAILLASGVLAAAAVFGGRSSQGPRPV